jgi:hypothetical protein
VAGKNRDIPQFIGKDVARQKPTRKMTMMMRDKFVMP